MFIENTDPSVVIVLPVICPVTFVQSDVGVVEATIVVPFATPVGILPFNV